MADNGNERRDSDPEIEVIPAPERIKLIRQRDQLTKILGKMGFRQLVTDDADMQEGCVFLMKDGTQGNQMGGLRIFIPESNDHLQMALFSNEEKNAEIVRAINDSGYFRAEKDDLEGSVIGEYFNVTMIKEPPVTSTKIKIFEFRTGTTNRILALLRQVFFG
jgi:hypothetical protein